jgi:TRAP-type C4-dicarboxylate transport system substrate-binding protein
MLRVALLVLALFVAAPRVAQAEPVTLRVATLAPASSTWGKLFTAWQRGVVARSHGALAVQVFYGTQQGDELAMVSKMRTHQLDGAALTATGLAQIYKDVLVFELPGLFRDWAHLDRARTAMRPTLDAAFDARGFRIVSWGDVGITHLMTRGVEARVPSDLRRARCFYLPGDPVGPAFFQAAAGGIVAKALSVPEILPALQSGSVNLLSAPSLVAEQLQWTSVLDHIDVRPTNVAIGAFLMSSARVRSLPADLAAVLLDAGPSGPGGDDTIRREDAASFARLKAKMKAYETSDAEEAQWQAVFDDMRRHVRGAVFDPVIYDRMVSLAAAAP